METLKELYKIGRGPSSSHTIGPEKIARYIKGLYGERDYTVTLYGSLAMTGKGHGTDRVLKEVLGASTRVVCDAEKNELPHPNTLDVSFDLDGEKRVVRGVSVGGGSVKIEGVEFQAPAKVYKLNDFKSIKGYCIEKGIRLCDYVYEVEADVKEYLSLVWKTMKQSIEQGLKESGVLPGGLNLQRKAAYLYQKEDVKGDAALKQYRLVSAYAFAVAETNASNGTVVTAPTCGASGVLPAVLYYEQTTRNVSDEKIIDALATAGVIGNVVKTNASISGAECGCQAEVGTACSMAAAALGEVYGLSVDQIECAAEIAMEHNLGLTCDPALGLVQVPCIERNATAAVRAFNSFCIAYYLSPFRQISFDEIVKTMYETGKDLNKKYLETSSGGIARRFAERI